MSDPTRDKVRDWWRTEIVNVSDGQIRYRGYAIEELIGKVGFVEVVWLLLRGELPEAAEARLLEAAMVSPVNAGPMSPSCAILGHGDHLRRWAEQCRGLRDQRPW